MKKGKRLNKKGNVFADFILIPVMLVVIVVTMFLAYYAYDKLKTDSFLFNNVGEEYGSTAQGEIRNAMDVTTGMFQYIFVMIIASMLVLLILSAYFIDSSIVFMVIGIIIMIITIVVSVPFSNFYEEFSEEGEFETVHDNFSIINNIMNNLSYYVFFLGSVFILILYGKKSSGGGGYYQY